MLLLVEKRIRGCISMISKRHVKANNKYMTKYNEEQELIFIKYLDANNLYGHSMSQTPPTHGFKWMTKSMLNNWKKHPCIPKVDLSYPVKLHNLHNEYPLAPERLMVDKVRKLIPNLSNKTKYVVRHETLKLYESLVTKVHRVNHIP